MSLIRSTPIVVSAIGKRHEGVEPRSRLAATGIQIISLAGMRWAKKALTLRNVPFTAINPSPLQALIRGAFGAFNHERPGLPPWERIQVVHTEFPKVVERLRAELGPEYERLSERTFKRSTRTYEQNLNEVEKRFKGAKEIVRRVTLGPATTSAGLKMVTSA